jgi:hypothetical protein
LPRSAWTPQDGGATIVGMAGEPTLRLGDQSVDGWVEYLQSQLVNHRNWVDGLPDDTWVPTGVFDEQTEHYVRVFQRGVGIQVDGVVGDETWNMLHGMADTVDPATDGRDPHTFVEESPRLEWENDWIRVDDRTYRYAVVNVGSTPVASVRVRLDASGDVGVESNELDGHTYDGEPAPPGGRMYFDVVLQRPLEDGEMVPLDMSLPAENGGARFAPALTG